MKAAPAAFEFRRFSTKQKKLLTWWMDASPYRDYDMVIADGAIRSGKTVSMIDSFIMWSQARHSNQSFIIAGKSMGTLKRNVLKPMFQILSAKRIPYHYHRSEHYIEIGTNTYYCFGASNEAAQDVLQGLTAAGAMADEVALFPRSFVEQMIGRCSVEGAKLFMNCNPEGPYHFVKSELIDKAAEKRILHLHFTMDDNLTLSPTRKEFYKRMYTGLFYQRMILGLWTLAEGVIYDNFDRSVHVISPAELEQRFGQTTIPKEWKRFRSIDFGFNHPFVCQWWAVSPDGEWFLYREIYRTKRLVEDHAKQIVQLSEGERYTGTFADHDAEDRATLDRYGVKTRTAQKSVTPGIQECHKMLTPDPKTGRPRIYILSNALVESDPELVEAGLPTCTADEFATYVWLPPDKSKGEDEPVKDKDHGMDAMRYVIYTMLILGSRSMDGMQIDLDVGKRESIWKP